jgi:hypothetical protein
MTERSLSELYRKLNAHAPLSSRALIDSETAVRASRGRVVPHERLEVAGALAASTAHADLVRLLRALEPASTELAQSLAQSAPVHEHRERHQRVAHGRRHGERGWQWGALAASLVAAVALFAARGNIHGMGEEAALAKLHDAPVDGIFGNALETRFAHHDKSDTISRADFNGDRPDHIFSGRLGGG